MKKKVLICGASGFIGRNLFKHLSQNSELEVFGTFWKNKFSDNEKLLQVNLVNKEWAKTVTQGIDVVINAAAITDGSGAVATNPGKYITDNNRINENLIESAHENQVSNFIFLSCSVVYPQNNPLPVKETQADLSRVHPKYWMGARMKMFGEDLCRYYSELGQTRFTVIRHSNVYGPHDKFSVRGHVFAGTIAKVLSPENDKVVVWGDGYEVRDLLHVSDFARFIELVLGYGNRYDVFNVGSGCSLSVRELVEKINTISVQNLPVHYDLSKSSINTNIILDITKAKEVFGWQPQIDIDEGIWQTLEWYLKNKPR